MNFSKGKPVKSSILFNSNCTFYIQHELVYKCASARMRDGICMYIVFVLKKIDRDADEQCMSEIVNGHEQKEMMSQTKIYAHAQRFVVVVVGIE